MAACTWPDLQLCGQLQGPFICIVAQAHLKSRLFMLGCHMIAQHLLTGGAQESSPAYTADVGMGLCILLQLTGTCQEGMLQVFTMPLIVTAAFACAS